MYEYKCIEFDSSVEAEAYMNKMGSVGWRVVSTTWRESIPIRSLYVTFERVKAAAMGLSSDDLPWKEKKEEPIPPMTDVYCPRCKQYCHPSSLKIEIKVRDYESEEA